MSTGGNPAFEIFGDIGLDTSGVEQKIEKLRALLDKVATSINSTQAAISAGTAPASAIDRLQRLTDIYGRLDDQLAALSSTGSVLNASMAATSGGATASAAGWQKFGQVILSVGQIADDAQYGFRAIANNIPMIFAPLGPAAMGAAAITATATNQIINHWDAVGPALRETLEGIGLELGEVGRPEHLTGFEELERRVKSLKAEAESSVDSLHKFIAAERELKDATAAGKAFEGVARAEPAPEEKAAGAALGKFVAGEEIAGGRGGEDLTGAIFRAMVGKGTVGTLPGVGGELPNRIKTAQAEVEGLRARLAAAVPGTDEHASVTEQLEGSKFFKMTGIGPGGAQDRLAKLQAQQEKAARDAIEKQIGAAASGDADARGAVEGMIGFLDPAAAEKLRRAIGSAAEKARAEKDRALTDAAAENERRTLELAKEESPALAEAILAASGDDQALKKFRQQQADKLRQQGEANERETIERLKRESPPMAEAMLRASGDAQAANDLVRQQNEALNQQGEAGEAEAIRQAQKDDRPDIARELLRTRNDRAALAEFDKAEDERRRREAIKAAEEAVPGIGGMVESGLLHTPGPAADADVKARREVARRLGEAGLGDQAGVAAQALVRDARRKLEEQAAKVANDPFALAALREEAAGGGQPRRQSQVLDVGSFAHTLQASVGGDIDRQQLQRMDRANALLQQIVIAAQKKNVAVFG